MRPSLTETCDLLMNGKVVAMPTETVYGLAASLKCPEAIDAIFALKGRPSDNPLIIHVGSAHDILPYIDNVPKDFERLAHAFWPGPLTLVMPVHVERIPNRVRAGLPTAAFRVPNHPLTLDVLNRVGALVMPSANLSGKPSATQPEHVETDFGEAFPVLDGGSCNRGVESTILIHQNNRWVIGRLGALSAEEFIPILGYAPAAAEKPTGTAPLCPGQLYKHYSPQARLLLQPSTPPEGVEAVIGFSDRSYETTAQVFYLGSSKHPSTAAENLYALLRELDRQGIQTAWVDMNFPRHGLWVTIAERLKKAAGI